MPVLLYPSFCIYVSILFSIRNVYVLSIISIDLSILSILWIRSTYSIIYLSTRSSYLDLSVRSIYMSVCLSSVLLEGPRDNDCPHYQDSEPKFPFPLGEPTWNTLTCQASCQRSAESFQKTQKLVVKVPCGQLWDSLNFQRAKNCHEPKPSN